MPNAKPDRSKIVMEDETSVKRWMKHLDVTREELRKAVDKVGDSAAAVKKQLGKGPVPAVDVPSDEVDNPAFPIL